MPITGTLAADFTSFYDAVTTADVKLKSFDDDARKVGKSLATMADSFSGRKIITEATQMAAVFDDVSLKGRFTNSELTRMASVGAEATAKLKALGQDVPPGIQRIADAAKGVGENLTASQGVLGSFAGYVAGAFTIGAVVQFGREVLAAGDAIQKMADQTGLSYKEVQQLQYVAGQSGTSIESLVGAVQNLQQKLGSGDEGAAGAMSRLKINTEDFLKLPTYQQLTTMASALQGVQDPTEQAALSASVFGKTWKEVLPAIKAGMKETGDAATTMADDVVRATDRIGDSMDAAKRITIVAGASIVGELEQMGFRLGDYFSRLDPSHWGTANSELLKHQEALARVSNVLSGAQVPQKQYADGIKAITLSQQELNTWYKTTDATLAESIEANKKAADEAKRMAEIMAELRNVGAGWKGTLDTINGAVVESVKYYLDAGVSQKTLGDAYALTDAQVRAVAESLKAETAELQKQIAIRTQRTAVIAQEVLGEAQATQQLTALYAQQTGATRDQTSAAETLRLGLDALHATKVEGFSQTERETLLYQQYTDALYKEASAADEARDKNAGLASSLGAIPGVANQATSAMYGLIDSMKDYKSFGQDGWFGWAPTGAMPTVISLPSTLGLATGAAQTGGTFTPKRAAGGPVERGTSYLVGEQGPELFTPKQGGTIIPNGATGGINVSIVVNGSVLSNKAQLAAAVGDALIAKLRAAGVRLGN